MGVLEHSTGPGSILTIFSVVVLGGVQCLGKAVMS